MLGKLAVSCAVHGLNATLPLTCALAAMDVLTAFDEWIRAGAPKQRARGGRGRKRPADAIAGQYFQDLKNECVRRTWRGLASLSWMLQKAQRDERGGARRNVKLELAYIFFIQLSETLQDDICALGAAVPTGRMDPEAEAFLAERRVAEGAQLPPR